MRATDPSYYARKALEDHRGGMLIRAGSPDSLHTTHTIGYAVSRDADTFEESNYAAMYRELETYTNTFSGYYASCGLEAIDGDEECSLLSERRHEHDPDVFTGRASCSLFGYFEEIHVRVVLDPTLPEGEHEGELYHESNLSEAFLTLVGLLESLESYPLLDEEDYLEREHEELHRYLTDDERVPEDLVPFVLETLEVSRPDDLRQGDLADALAFPLLECERDLRLLESQCEGQLTLDGETVTLPPLPSREWLETLERGLDVIERDTPRDRYGLEVPPRDVRVRDLLEATAVDYLRASPSLATLEALARQWRAAGIAPVSDYGDEALEASLESAL